MSRSNISVATTSSEPLVFHCNNCLQELRLFEDAPATGPRGDQVHKRYLTECFHVLCQNCRLRGIHKCVTCNRNTRFMEISRKMPKQYQFYFEQSAVVRKLYGNVMKFQQRQDDLVISKMAIKQEHFEQKCAVAIKVYEDTKKEWKQKEAENRKIKIIFKKIAEEKQ